MRRRVPMLAALLLALLATATATAMAAEAPRASLPDVEDEVMCVECGTALNISTAPVADRERAFIRDQIAAGKTKEEIKAALVAEFGPAVLALPDDDGFNLAVYLIPAALALLALAGVAITAGRWRRPAPAAPTASPGAALDPGEASRLDADLAAYDR